MNEFKKIKLKTVDAKQLDFVFHDDSKTEKSVPESVENEPSTEYDLEAEEEINKNKEFLEELKNKYTFVDLSKVVVSEKGFEIDGNIMSEKDINSYAWKINQEILNDLYKKNPGDDKHIPPGNRPYN